MKDRIAELAELQFLDSEIAKIMEITVEELVSTYSEAIDVGRLKAEAQVRMTIFESAKKGDLSAQKTFMNLNQKAKNASKR